MATRRSRVPLTPKTETVIGTTPTEWRRVKILIREETFKNPGGGSRWTTTTVAEPIVINAANIDDVRKKIIDVLSRAA